MGTTKKVKAIELVFDWNLWPRSEAGELDHTNIQRLKAAIVAGVKIPPVIANQKDYRIIDGFHRVKAYLLLFGDEAEIEVELKNYKNEGEMFLDSARLNNNHGLPLSPSDRAHAIEKSKKLFKIPLAKIADCLGMDKEYAMDFLDKRSAMSKSGERIILTGGSLNLKGKTLTKKQEEYVKSRPPGTSAQMYARLLLNALNADAVIFSDKVIVSLRELFVKIEKLLLGVEA